LGARVSARFAARAPVARLVDRFYGLLARRSASGRFGAWSAGSWRRSACRTAIHRTRKGAVMSFSDDLTSCMSPLPAPTVEGANELMEFLDQLHSAWESSGGDEEMLLTALVAAGAVTGIDEAALATAGTVTVVAYLAALVACSVSVLA